MPFAIERLNKKQARLNKGTDRGFWAATQKRVEKRHVPSGNLWRNMKENMKVIESDAKGHSSALGDTPFADKVDLVKLLGDSRNLRVR